MFAGASGSGKSYLASGNIVRECQKQGITPIILDTENALDEEWLQRIGVDTSPDKLMRFPVAMINDVGKIMSLFIEDYKANYMDLPLEERPKFMIVIDSLSLALIHRKIGIECFYLLVDVIYFVYEKICNAWHGNCFVNSLQYAGGRFSFNKI